MTVDVLLNYIEYKVNIISITLYLYITDIIIYLKSG